MELTFDQAISDAMSFLTTRYKDGHGVKKIQHRCSYAGFMCGGLPVQNNPGYIEDAAKHSKFTL